MRCPAVALASIVTVIAAPLAGCHDLFSLDPISHPSGMPDADRGGDLDGDGFVQDDNCPAITNPDQIDDDGDGIGNACDPHLDQLDEIVLQELFEDDILEGWSVSGTWTRTPGAWQSPPPTELGTLTVATPRELFRPAIQVGFSFDAYSPQLDIRELSIHLDAPTLVGDCAFRHNPNLAELQDQLVLHVGDANSGEYVPVWQFDTRYVGTYVRGLTSECTVQAISEDDEDRVERFTTAPSITTKRLQATLHHVTIYQVISP